jgi:hypothetical protein
VAEFERKVRNHRLMMSGFAVIIAVSGVTALLVDPRFDWLTLIPILAVPLLIVDAVRAPKSLRR